MRDLRFLVALFGTLFVLSGCPSGDDDDDVAGDDDDAADDDAVGDDDDAVGDDDDAVGDDDDASDPVVTATVTVPEGFDDVPVALFVGYLESFDEDEDPVAGHGLELDDPDIGDGNPLEIVAIQDGLAGEYIIVVVLYVEGGAPKAEGWPVEGVDHAWYAEAQTLGSGDLHLGTIEVIPWVMPQ